eukprot:3407285-Prymnesium_polylepis.1
MPVAQCMYRILTTGLHSDRQRNVEDVNAKVRQNSRTEPRSGTTPKLDMPSGSWGARIVGDRRLGGWGEV